MGFQAYRLYTRCMTTTALQRFMFGGAILLVVACRATITIVGDDSETNSSDDDTASSSASSAGTTGGSGGMGGAAGEREVYVDCPSAAPVDGGVCTEELSDAYCSYGDAVLSSCRDVFVCNCSPSQCEFSKLTWLCHDQSGCPSAPPITGEICALDGWQACGYVDGASCHCAQCELDGFDPCAPLDPWEWRCRPLNPVGCPPVIPNAGTTCKQDVAGCDYDGGCGLNLSCVDGRWNWTQYGCTL
jgi:hypothetical protein